MAGVAVVEMVRGEISNSALKDFEAKLRGMGVSRFTWERHKADGTVKNVAKAI